MSRGKAITIALLIIMMLAGVAGGLSMSKKTTPVVKFTSQIEEGDYEGAQEAYQEKILVNETYSDDANAAVAEHLQKALEEYLSDSTTYDAVAAQVEMIEDVMTEMNMEDIKSRLEGIKESKDGYAQGKKAEKKKKYIQAYEGYGKVLPEDGNYTDAQACMEKLKKAYTKAEIKQVEKLIKQKKYKQAVKETEELLKDALKDNSKLKNLKKKAAQLEKKAEKKTKKTKKTKKSSQKKSAKKKKNTSKSAKKKAANKKSGKKKSSGKKSANKKSGRKNKKK